MLPSLSNLRKKDFSPKECASFLKYLKRYNMDFDVYLPKYNRNLQREHVWNIMQKQEIIMSLILERHIPHLSLLNIVTPDGTEKYQVIDGKQRLSSMFEFIDNKFSIELDGKSYTFSELPEEYQTGILCAHVRYYIIYDEIDKPISDDLKIDWFRFINYAGTPQDREHMDGLTVKAE